MPSFPELSIDSDWFGNQLSPSAKHTLGFTGKGLLFEAFRDALSLSHPASEEAKFQENLWKYDVAEIFLLEKDTGRYLEVNLAPNGAWWACWHDGVRQREKNQPSFEGVKAEGGKFAEGWKASIFLPESLFQNPKTLHYNVTFILNSPNQSFHTLAKLPGDEPDFHQPDFFLPLDRAVPS